MPAADILHTLTDANNSAADIVGALIGYGPLGLLILDLGVTRKVFTFTWILRLVEAERERDRVAYEQRIAAMSEVITKLTELTETQMIPALTRATDVNKDYVALLSERSRRAE